MILNDLTPEELAAVEQNGMQRVCGKGEYIIREDEAGSSFFLILQGRVEVRKSIGGEKYKKLVELGPLDIFGEVCFLGVECRSASVLALEQTTVLEFSKARLDAVIAERPVVGLKLYRGLARELAHRLARVDSDLKDAIVWALGDHKSSADPSIASSRKLTVCPPPQVGVPARIIVV